MNVVVLLNDTLRADHISAYGLPQPWDRPGHDGRPFIETPYLDGLISESISFHRYYTGSYPTIPARYDLFTGRFGFPTRGWEPLEADDLTFAEWLSDHGYTTELIFDTPALANDEYNFTRGFTGWDWVRGQHRDRWVTDPVSVPLPAAAYKLHNVPGLRNYQLNATRRVYERDWMCAKTTSTAMDWLERNWTRDQFVLWVDMWDPHEPFDAPAHDLVRYRDPAYRGDFITYPRYGRVNYLAHEELNDIRALYAAKVTLVDRWVGQFLDRIDALGLRENTLIIYLSDHGHLFGEHDLLGKPTGPLGMLYEPSIRIPLIIRHPDGRGAAQRIQALAQPCDILPTVLDFLRVPVSETVVGKSLWPVIDGTAASVHEYAFSGRFSRQTSFQGPGRVRKQNAAMTFDGWVGIDGISEPLTVTTDEWSLICHPAGSRQSELYYLREDPGQAGNVIDAHRSVAESLNRALLEFLREHGASPERTRAYAWSDATGHAGDAQDSALDPRTHCWTVAVGETILAFLTPQEAADCGAGASAGAVRETTLAALQQTDPKALVCVGDQYFWAEDIPVPRKAD